MRNRAFCTLFFVALAVAPALAQDQADNFPRYNFNAGGGYGIGRGLVGSLVGNSFFGVGGAGVNLSRVFGLSGEFMYYDLTLRPSVSNRQGLPGNSGSLDSFSLNGIVRAPYHWGPFGAYGIFGVGFYRRTESTTKETLSYGPCQPAWVWWDVYCNGNPPSIQTPQTISTFTKDAGGYNFGGGITYRLNHLHNAKIYGEFRYHKAYHSDTETVVWPLTVGLRW